MVSVIAAPPPLLSHSHWASPHRAVVWHAVGDGCVRLPSSVRPCRPLYLTLNVAGPAKYKGMPNSHFNPHAALFKPSQVFDVIVSNVGMLLAGAVIAASVLQFGWQKVVFYYGVPYLVVNSYLVLIT